VTESPGDLRELLERGYRYAYALTHERARSEDLLQDAWLAVLKAKGPHTKTYLFSAIRSRFINQYRRERLVSIIPLEEILESQGIAETNGMRFSLPTDSLLDIEKALASLRPAEREAVFLNVIEGYTAREIAASTNQPRGTVLGLVFRARLKLRRFFESRARGGSGGIG
jgi:RNA polymerase sigma-70 factor, ECF subfamily